MHARHVLGGNGSGIDVDHAARSAVQLPETVEEEAVVRAVDGYRRQDDVRDAEGGFVGEECGQRGGFGAVGCAFREGVVCLGRCVRGFSTRGSGGG